MAMRGTAYLDVRAGASDIMKRPRGSITSSSTGGEDKKPANRLLSEEAWKVLVLGDGNLSYSLSLALALPNSVVWCTTWDRREEVKDKYRESHFTIKRLEKMAPRVKVLHEVDALDIRQSLHLALGQQEEEEETMGPFDHIIFNHPHTGFECAKRHQALCAHFLESCKAVLSPGGLVHVTLAGEQEARWQLTSSATRLGYTLRHRCDFYLQFGRQLTGIEVKRHQSGKSFRLRDLRSVTYSFASAGGGGDDGGRVVEVPWKHELGTDEAVAAVTTTAVTTQVSHRPHACDKCDRSFRTVNDLLKHKKVHEGGGAAAAGGGDGGGGGGKDQPGFKCDKCDRVFGMKDALIQHVQSKHGEHPDLKPDWYGGASPDASSTSSVQSARFKGITEAVEGWIHCAICEFYSPPSVDHVLDLRPPERPVLRCQGCAREFHEERAIKQHAMNCRALKEAAAAAISSGSTGAGASVDVSA